MSTFFSMVRLTAPSCTATLTSCPSRVSATCTRACSWKSARAASEAGVGVSTSEWRLRTIRWTLSSAAILSVGMTMS